MSNHNSLPTEIISDALLLAANKLAIEKIAADERREKREFIKTVILALVVGLPAIIAAAGSVMAVRQIEHVGHSVNSMKDELVDSVRKASHAKGVLEGKADKDSK